VVIEDIDRKVGIEFVHMEDQLKFEDLFMVEQKVEEDNKVIELERLNEDGTTLYFVNVIITSAETIALALGSTFKCVEAFQRVLYFALLDYLNSANKKEIIEKLYNALSTLDLKY
jgi:hypothetical protein